MHKEIEFDGRKIKIKTSLSEEETGVMVEKDDYDSACLEEYQYEHDRSI